MLVKDTSVFLIKNVDGVFELWGIRLTRKNTSLRFKKQQYLISVLSDNYKNSLTYAKGYATKNSLYLKSTHLNFI